MSSDARKRTAFAVLSWALVGAWAVFIFSMSAHTGSDFAHGTDFVAQVKQWLDDIQKALLGDGIDVVSSAAHFCEYTVFGALLFNAVRLHAPSLRWSILLAVAIASLYGVSDEIHQIFVPARCCDPVDWLVDTLGATLGTTISYAVASRCARHRD